MIMTEPEGAEIHINGIFFGRSPRLVNDLEMGAHNLFLYYPGYEEINKIIILENSNLIELNEYLFAKTGNLRVLSDPIGAKVFIDDLFISYTPLDLPELLVKKYYLRLELDSYETIYDEIYIKQSINLTKDYILKSKLGSVRIYAQPEGLKLNINNKTFLERSPEIINLKLEQGRYELEFLKIGYQPIKTDINIDSNEEQNFNIFLKKLPTGIPKLASYGFLNVSSENPDIKVKIKGIKGKFELPLTYYELNEGSYEIILFGKGKESQRLDINIDRQRTTFIKANLKPKKRFLDNFFK